MATNLPTPPALVTPVVYNAGNTDYSLALIIDNIVYQVLSTDGQGAAMFLANPTFVQVDKTQVSLGEVYDPATNTFSDPQ